MRIDSSIESYVQVLGSEGRRVLRRPSCEPKTTSPLAITISRQTGSGAYCVAECLARYLESHAPGDSHPWKVFDRNLVEKVLVDHNLSPGIARFIPEDRLPLFTDALDELLGLHPSYFTLVEQSIETISNLAKEGNVILIGRGAHVITRPLPHVFHVRLVGSLDRRVEHIQELHGMDKDRALAFIHHFDRGRRRYLKKYFAEDIDDPLSYHLTVNTDELPYEATARMIGDMALSRVVSRV